MQAPTRMPQKEVESIEGHELISQNASTSDHIQLEKDWDRATADYDYIMIPGKPPVRRRHRNKWTDADESELRAHGKSQPCSHLFVAIETHNNLTFQQFGGDENPEFDTTLRAVLDAN